MGTAISRLGLESREDACMGNNSTDAVILEGAGPGARDGTEQDGRALPNATAA